MPGKGSILGPIARRRMWRRKSGLVLIVHASFLTFFAVLVPLFHVWQKNEVTHYGRLLIEIKEKEEKLRKENQVLELELSRLEAAARVERICTGELRLRPAEPWQIVYLKSEGPGYLRPKVTAPVDASQPGDTGESVVAGLADEEGEGAVHRAGVF